MTEQSEIIVLFDEFGTPSFQDNSTNNFFVGVCTIYELSKEQEIFNAVDNLMGLSNTNPLKNNRITKNRARNISQIACTQPIEITAFYIDLQVQELHETTNLHMQFSDIERRLARGITKERKEANFFHSQLLNDCLSYILISFIMKRKENFNFQIFIDDCTYPEPDRIIALEDSTKFLKNRIYQNIIDDLKLDISINIENIMLLTDANSKRKRFIDVLTTVCSRSFLDESNPKYDREPLNILSTGLRDRFMVQSDTAEMINFMKNMIDYCIKKTKSVDAKLIII